MACTRNGRTLDAGINADTAMLEQTVTKGIALDHPPDLDLDAYILANGEKGPLCEVRVWLPKDPSEDGRIDVTAHGATTQDIDLGAALSLVSPEGAQYHFSASDLLVRSMSSPIGNPIDRVRIHIEHIGKICIGDKSQACIKDAVFFLSQMHYALPRKIWTNEVTGNRSFHLHRAALQLPILYEDGNIYDFQLDRQWSWISDKEGDSVTARSSPVLTYHSGKSRVSLKILQDCAQTATLLLSLAARWPVMIYSTRAYVGIDYHEVWQYPISRNRAYGIERAEGRLVQESDLERYVAEAARRLVGFNTNARDAVRHAVVALQPFGNNSMEANFLARLIALEGLARNFGSSQRGMHLKIGALLSAYPPAIQGLWPILGSNGLPGLRDLRNDLAHGVNLSRKVSGAISLASDHLQLWLEYILLAILHVSSIHHRESHLEAQVRARGQELNVIRNALHTVGLTC